MRENLQPYIDQLSNPSLKVTCLTLLDYPDFWTHPASTGIHHGYVGGLWIHTKEVVDFTLHQAQLFPAVNKDVIIAAALWHDLAKIWDYKLVTYFNDQFGEIPKYYVFHSEENDEDSSWKKVYITDADYKNQIHHITGSTAEFTARAISCGVNRETIQKVQACIISHHGPVKEWGSPRAPQTLEAVILHQSDYLSAHFGPKK